MQRYLAEMIGTFALVFVGTAAIVISDQYQPAIGHVAISLVFGLIVMSMIYSIGEISGAHINPAVTFGFWLTGRFPAADVAPYLFSQVLGAFLASGLVKILFGSHPTLGATLPAGEPAQAFLLELILTFILMFVILQVATGSREQGIMAGIAIGGVVGLEALFAGPVSGASMNPVRSLAPAVMAGNYHGLWIYLTAPFIGAALAMLVYRFLTYLGKMEKVTDTKQHEESA